MEGRDDMSKKIAILPLAVLVGTSAIVPLMANIHPVYAVPSTSASNTTLDQASRMVSQALATNNSKSVILKDLALKKVQSLPSSSKKTSLLNQLTELQQHQTIQFIDGRIEYIMYHSDNMGLDLSYLQSQINTIKDVKTKASLQSKYNMVKDKYHVNSANAHAEMASTYLSTDEINQAINDVNQIKDQRLKASVHSKVIAEKDRMYRGLALNLSGATNYTLNPDFLVSATNYANKIENTAMKADVLKEIQIERDRCKTVKVTFDKVERAISNINKHPCPETVQYAKNLVNSSSQYKNNKFIQNDLKSAVNGYFMVTAENQLAIAKVTGNSQNITNAKNGVNSITSLSIKDHLIGDIKATNDWVYEHRINWYLSVDKNNVGTFTANDAVQLMNNYNGIVQTTEKNHYGAEVKERLDEYNSRIINDCIEGYKKTKVADYKTAATSYTNKIYNSKIKSVFQSQIASLH